MKSSILAIALAGFALCAPAQEQQIEDISVVIKFTSWAGNQYEWSCSARRFKQAPRWDPEKQPNPPVSAADALKKTRAFLGRVPKPKEGAWEIVWLTIERVDILDEGHGWMWSVAYMPSNAQGQGMHCFILMDGEVIEPVVTPQKQ